jgi:chromosome segregation ATPase
VDDEGTDELEAEITQLKDDIAALENESGEAEDIELADADAEERIRTLEDRLSDVEQLHDDVLRQREEDSRKATQMLDQLIGKQNQEEGVHQGELRTRIDTLNEMDREQSEKLEDIARETAEGKERVVASIRSAAAKLQQMRSTVAKRQRDYERAIQELQVVADGQRTSLEARTTRQQQQLKEAVALAKKFGDEKRRFVAMHRELEMLNAEKVREAVEHATLMRGVSKMDGFVLSRISAGQSSRPATGGATMAKSTKF